MRYKTLMHRSEKLLVIYIFYNIYVFKTHINLVYNILIIYIYIVYVYTMYACIYYTYYTDFFGYFLCDFLF